METLACKMSTRLFTRSTSKFTRIKKTMKNHLFVHLDIETVRHLVIELVEPEIEGAYV